VVFAGCNTGCKQPDVKAIGTQRQRSVKSGADEMLDDDDGEEDDDEEDILTKDTIVRHVSHELNLHHEGHGS